MTTSEDRVRSAVQLAQSGRIPDAIALLEAAVREFPASAQVPGLLGTLLMNVGRLDQALPHLRRAHELAPSEAHLALQLGAILASMQRPLEGLPYMQRATDLAPAWMPGLLAFARTLQSVGDFERAEAVYQRAVAAEPRNAEATCALGALFLVSGRVAQAIDCFRRAGREHPNDPLVQGRLLSALNYAGDATHEEVFEAHQRWGRLVAARGTDSPVFANTRDPGRRLRIGLLSTDLWDHSCAYFLRPILAARDPAKLEFICYSASTSSDWMTEQLKTSADVWRSVAGLDDRALVDAIRRDSIDILIELSGHTANGPLAALRSRAAPVQAMYLGYPNTTGLATIDWRIVDAITDPPGAERFSTERLARIDTCFLCYSGTDLTPPPHRPPSPTITFGSFNSIRKLGPEVISAWSRVLLAVPNSRLLIKTRGISTPVARREFSQAFAWAGIEPARLDLLDGVPGKSDHLAMYSRLDIALDTFPYNGTTTTCEALWMGVPVVTCEGSMHAGRVGASLLRAAGLGDLIAPNQDAFVSLAACLALEPARLADARSGVRNLRSSSLCDATSFATRFERVLRQMWHDYCARPA